MMKGLNFLIVLSVLFICSSLAIQAQEIKVGNSIRVTPDGVKVGDIEVKNDGETVTIGDDSESGNRKEYKKEDFVGVDLSGHSFKGAKFFATDFENSNLSYADFSDTRMNGVDFENVNLEGACFVNARLNGVDFTSSNLNGAVFTNSSRNGVDFVGSDTTGVIWNGTTECPGQKTSEASEQEEVSSRPEVIEAESIKQALIAGPDSRIDLTVNFPNDSDEIKAQAHVQVLEIANALKSPELTNKRILIEGHTDNVGEEDYNVDLSYRRAVRVMRVLTEEYGIDSLRLQVKGYGEEIPVASNNSDQGRALNRRVTLVNIGNI